MPQQVTRLAMAFAVGVGGLLLARHLYIPESFGEYGHYRGVALDSAASHPRMYAGQEQCGLCHSDVEGVRSASSHQSVSCEVCHGPAAQHVAGPMEVTPRIHPERGPCLICHAYDPARPTGFPQVDPTSHNTSMACVTCHSPHGPEIPLVPGDCSACHGQISRQKSVSHHAALPCTTCHQTPEEHKTSPRTVLPSVPDDRAFCGTCHSNEDSGSTGPPQVNLSAHGERHLCWQCHYPHNPEIGS